MLPLSALGWKEDSGAELGQFKQAFIVKFSLELLNKVTNPWGINDNIYSLRRKTKPRKLR